MLYLACDSDSSTGILINYDVDYIVEGTADSVTVKYKTADGDTVTVSGVTLPWNYLWTRKGIHNDTAYIYAEATNTSVRFLKVGILTNGSVLDTVSTTGPGKISVSLTMTLP
jgi:hypothetical protein